MTLSRGRALPLALLILGSFACQGPAGQWRTNGALPELRHSAGAATIAGKIYYVGGVPDGCTSDGPECRSDRVDIYEPVARAWSRGPALPMPRSRPAVVALAGELYVMGGSGPDASGANDGLRDSNFVLRAGEWLSRAALPYPRAAMSAEVLNGHIYLVGGVMPDLMSYDPVADTWTQHAAIPTPRRQVGTCAQGTKLLVAGGWGLDLPERASAVAELYDAATDAWTSVAPLPTARGGLGGGLIAGSCFLLGGQHVIADETKVALGDNEGFRFASGRWEAYRPMPSLRTDRAYAVVGNDLYVLGGLTVSNAEPGAAFERFAPIPAP